MIDTLRRGGSGATAAEGQAGGDVEGQRQQDQPDIRRHGGAAGEQGVGSTGNLLFFKFYSILFIIFLFGFIFI